MIWKISVRIKALVEHLSIRFQKFLAILNMAQQQIFNHSHPHLLKSKYHGQGKIMTKSKKHSSMWFCNKFSTTAIHFKLPKYRGYCSKSKNLSRKPTAWKAKILLQQKSMDTWQGASTWEIIDAVCILLIICQTHAFYEFHFLSYFLKSGVWMKTKISTLSLAK